ncbi:MAG TPA: hypothetical protein VGX03_33580 [Candidatus Binatia bacterium]|nr:hypothetical protein [Candidatus Binatia bacterium]
MLVSAGNAPLIPASLLSLFIQVQTAVERTQAALNQAKADYERTKALAASELVAPTRLEHDELTVKLATKDVLAAKFEDQAAEHQVEMARAALLRVQTPARGRIAADQRGV